MRPNTVHVSFDSSRRTWEVYTYGGGRKIRLARAKIRAEADRLQRRYQDERNAKGTEAPILTSAQIDEYLRAKLALGEGTSLDLVVKEHLSRAEQPSISLEIAKGLFLEELTAKRLAKVSVRDYRCKLEALTRRHPGVSVEYFAKAPNAEAHPLQTFILEVSENPQTRVHYKTKLGTFFRWCEGRNWLSRHPNKWINLGRVARKTPEVYTPKDAEIILRRFETIRPRLVPYVAVIAFLGVRPSEAALLKVGKIDFKGKRIIVSHVKTGAAVDNQRPIDSPPPIIWKWLEPLRRESPDFLIFSGNFHQAKRIVLRGTGIKWIHDGFRHSCLSYFASIYGHDRAATLAGHEAGSYMLSTHYKNVLVTKRDAKAYFSIGPRGAATDKRKKS